MANKLLILYKAALINNNFGKIFELTEKYANKFENIDSYFIICDNNLDENIKIINNIIYVKLIENNWDSLLIKVILSFNLFINSNYTHILVSNISTFINIPLIYKNLENIPCLSHTGNYTFKNISYKFPSGALYIFTINVIKNICNFFNNNNFIINYKLSKHFSDNYPTTDDIFFGYYLHIKNINIKELERYDYIFSNIKNANFSYTHYRIKTNNYELDYYYNLQLFNNIYTNLL